MEHDILCDLPILLLVRLVMLRDVSFDSRRYAGVCTYVYAYVCICTVHMHIFELFNIICQRRMLMICNLANHCHKICAPIHINFYFLTFLLQYKCKKCISDFNKTHCCHLKLTQSLNLPVNI